MRSSLAAVLRWLLLTVVLAAATAAAAVVSGMAATPLPPGATPPDAAAVGGVLLLTCALVAALFSWAVARSTGWGVRLALAVFAAYFGLGTVLPQVESLLFLQGRLPPGLVGRLVVMGAIEGAVFAPAAVLVWGRWRRPVTASGAPWRSGDVVARTLVLAAVYVPVYLAAGYFIAYRNPELVAFYNDTDPGSFLAQLAKLWDGAPWLFAFQFARGVLWVVLVVPLIAWLRGGRIEAALLTAGLYAVWALLLLTPNQIMPDSVRLSHLVEIASSMLAYGALVGWVLGARRAPGTVAG